jgi:hypothetical protein
MRYINAFAAGWDEDAGRGGGIGMAGLPERSCFWSIPL